MAAGLVSGALPAAAQVHDPFGFATGAIEFELSPEAHRIVESARELHAGGGALER